MKKDKENCESSEVYDDKNRKNQKDKERNKKMLLWILIGILTVLIIGSIIFATVKQKKDEE